MTMDIVKADARHLVKSIDDLTRVSNILAASGYFTDARDAAQCGVKVLAGLEMGIGAFASMSGIHVIKGKPSIGAGLMAAAVKRSGKYNYRVTRHTNAECVIDFFERGEPCGTSSFTLDDAKAAGLAGSDNWRKAPRNMLFARALSNGVRWYCPDVFDTSTYVPEELGVDVDEEGNVLNTNPMPVQSTVQQPTVVAEVVPIESPVEPEQDAPITPNQVTKIMGIFAIAGINPRTPTGKDQASDLLSHVLNRPVITMKGMTIAEANAFIAAFTNDDGGIDEDEVRGVAMEITVG